MKKLILSTFALVLFAGSAFAVPNAQVYSPDATYDAVTDTWVVTSSDFEIWLVMANTNHHDFYDITLGMAFGGEENEPAPTGSITLTQTKGGSINETFLGPTDLTWGTPPVADPLPPHGIYPSWYAELLVGDLVGTYNETVLDYNPPFPSGHNDYGFVYKFDVSVSGFSYVHFDAWAWDQDLVHDKRIFAPFSHDAEMVPEPTSMILFGIGLAGAGVVRRFRATK